MRQSLIGRKNKFIEFVADFDLSLFREIVNKEEAFFDDIDVMSVIGLVSKLITDFGQKFVLILNVEFFVKFSVVNKVLSDLLAGLMIESKVLDNFSELVRSSSRLSLYFLRVQSTSPTSPLMYPIITIPKSCIMSTTAISWIFEGSKSPYPTVSMVVLEK